MSVFHVEGSPSEIPQEQKDVIKQLNNARFQGHGYSKFIREWSGDAKELTFTKETGELRLPNGTKITLYPEGQPSSSKAKTAGLPKFMRNIKAYHDREAHAGLDGRVNNLAEFILIKSLSDEDLQKLANNPAIKKELSAKFKEAAAKRPFDQGQILLKNGDEKEAAKYFKKASELGNTDASLMLDYLSKKGNLPQLNPSVSEGGNLQEEVNSRPDSSVAEPDRLQAADRGDAKSLYEQGVAAYRSSKPGTVERTRALELFEIAGAQGNRDALFDLGVHYQYGSNKDTSKAIEYYEKAAEKGHPNAQNKLGRFYSDPQFNRIDLAKSFNYYKAAADQGNSDAQQSVALHYLNGEGVPQNTQKAIEYFQKAAEGGASWSHYQLGNIYRDRGDWAQAIEHYKVASTTSSDNKYNLGIIYEQGRPGIPQDMTKAAEYFEAAAKDGNAEAALHLGNLYRDGKGVGKDLLKAIELYQDASEKKWHQTDPDHKRMAEQAKKQINNLISNNSSRSLIMQQLQSVPYLPREVRNKTVAEFKFQNDLWDYRNETKLLSNRVDLLNKLINATGDENLRGNFSSERRELKRREGVIKQVELVHPQWAPALNLREAQPILERGRQINEAANNPFVISNNGNRPFAINQEGARLSQNEINNLNTLRADLNIHPTQKLERVWLSGKMIRLYAVQALKDVPNINLAIVDNAQPPSPAFLKNEIGFLDKNDTRNIPITVHVGGNHWAFAYVDHEKKTLEYYDSFGQPLTNDVKASLNEAAAALKNKFGGEYTVQNKITKPIQDDHYQCGPWSLYFMMNRIANPNVEFNDLSNPEENTALIRGFRNHIFRAEINIRQNA